ncbi:MAG: bifunctional diaminohydroxyphosphoribosylaminopyrimidine deaminase/5-amino-6-(5-phosphoribosylamino)uracil reductase RibD [Rhodanobacteraceae bacterium]
MTAFDAIDHMHMAQALRLAERGLYTTQPNPRVGCVIARGEHVVGSGWHRRPGEPHAEVFALREAGERSRDATAYVTLEPCAHHGRTPPCADAMLAAGLARVVVACEDPFPEVAGRGIALLRAGGVSIAVGLLRDAARELNRGFFSRIERARPWVRLKLATSLDGRSALANGESKWITGEAARADAQHWRARSSAILTGSGTARNDNPHLTVRFENVEFRPPLRVLFDTRLDALHADANLLDGSAPTLIFHANSASPGHAGYAQAERAGAALCNGRIALVPAMQALVARGINELQVEAGPALCGALFDAGLVDELLWYVAPLLLGDTARPAMMLHPLPDMATRRPLTLIEQRQVGADLRLLLRPTQGTA